MSGTDGAERRRPARWEWAVLVGALALFAAQAALSAEHKSLVSDAFAHFAYGEWVLGKPYAPGDSKLGWDGVGSVTALHVASDRLRTTLTPWLGTPDDPATTQLGTIASLRWARLPSLAMGVVLLLGIWLVTRRIFGPIPAACAVLVGALEPNLIGHTRFIAADIPGALGFFAGGIALLGYVRRPTLVRLLVLGAALAIAQVIKSTNLLLYPITAGVVAIDWIRRHLDRERLVASVGRGLLTAIGMTILFGAMFIGALQAAYAGVDRTRDRIAAEAPIPSIVTRELGGPLWAARPFVPEAYTRTFALARAHNAIGHPSYLFGERRQHGWVTYFPIAMGLKTPLPILALALLGLLGFGWRRPVSFALLLLPAVIFLATMCLYVDVNIGVRHAIAVYPALVICAGVGLAGLVRLARRARPVGVALAVALVSWAGWQAAVTYPHHASYFNEVAGGPYEGWRCLLDSNVDWSQDRGLAERWAAAQSRPVAVNPLSPARGLIVIQASYVIGNSPEQAAASAWLREHHHPIARPAPSLFVYDVP